MKKPAVRGLEHLMCRALNMSCDDQQKLATRVAANLGYKLVHETSIQEAEDQDDVLNRLFRLEAKVFGETP